MNEQEQNSSERQTDVRNEASTPNQHPAAAKAPEKSTKKPLLDLAKYRGVNRVSVDGETATGDQTNIPIKKPGNKNFFRVHPDPSYRLYDVPVFEEDGGDIYLPELEELPDDVLEFVTHMHLFTAVSHRGKVFVWKFKATDTSWLHSNLRVAKRAVDEWIRIKADFETGGYNVFPAPEPLHSKKPTFPTMSPEEIFTLAFDSRRITSVEHPIIRSLRGLE
jgi:hypothetical protein